MSIRTRLALSVALVLIVTFAGLAIVFVRTTRATLVDQVDQRVVLSAQRGRGQPPGPAPDPESRSSKRSEATDGFERPVARLVYSPAGALLDQELSGFPDDPDPLPQLPARVAGIGDQQARAIITVPAVDNSMEYRALFQRVRGDVVVVTAVPLDEVDTALARMVRAIMLFGVLALAGASVVTWWLIRLGFRPVNQMIDTAAVIAGGDLGRRVPDADRKSELGRLGGALNEMLGQIEESDRQRATNEDRLRRFVADAAHELRTPLTSLRGYAELYRQGALPSTEAVSNAMGRIEAEGGRMARLVDDLLLLARLDQRRPLEREVFDLVPTVEEAIADFRAVEPERPLTEALADEAFVRGDRLRLRQVVDNLLVNARTHTPPETAVHVSLTRTRDAVTLVVADEGPGIPPDARARVFERFWRGDLGRGRQTGGTGLGLAIVASLVEAHGGSVDVTSELGHGAAFTVALPLASLEARGTAGHASPLYSTPASSLTNPTRVNRAT